MQLEQRGCGMDILKKEILSQELNWHPQLQEKLVQSLIPLLAHCLAPMKPHHVGATDFPSLHMIDLHMPESANMIAEWLSYKLPVCSCAARQMQTVSATEGNPGTLTLLGHGMFSAMLELDLIPEMSYLEYKQLPGREDPLKK